MRWGGSILLAATFGCSRGDKSVPPPAETASAPTIETREILYQDGATPLKGFIAWDAKATGKRAGVLVVHEWWGHNEHARKQARRLAEAGYVGLALDMYGDGKVTTHPDSAQAFVTEAMKDPAKLVARFNAAMAQLKQDPHVDPEKIAAIGYCFGGAVVLSMARAGADLDAVASFHGAIPPPTKIDSGNVRARVLILTGGADPMVPADQVEAFRTAIAAAGAPIEVVTYPNAKHSFTNPDADKVGMAGLGYDATIDQQSWAKLLQFLGDTFRAG